MVPKMKLSEFELDVMQLYWERGAASAPEIHLLIEKHRMASYSTVKTIIDRLEEKKALKRSRQDGRTIYYEPAIDRKAISGALLKKFLRRLFGGNHAELIVELLGDRDLSSKELDYIQKVIEERKNNTLEKK